MDILIQRRVMVLEYFNMSISEEGELSTLPLLIRNYTPNYGKLPTFLRRLGQNVPPFHPTLYSPIHSSCSPALSRFMLRWY